MMPTAEKRVRRISRGMHTLIPDRIPASGPVGMVQIGPDSVPRKVR